ncbi:MAG: ATP-grasp domain-containing protein, partial [Anaerolineae bacterium]|nr:ATP-grasp domain-containing protein [Anaerolineae bacterium]
MQQRRFVLSLALVGVVGLELFLTQEGQVLINEIAPR